MFYVINKEKVISYIVAVFTVILLYCIATTYNNEQAIPTANMVSNNTIEIVNQ
mgnify:FL=1